MTTDSSAKENRFKKVETIFTFPVFHFPLLIVSLIGKGVLLPFEDSSIPMASIFGN